MRSVGLVRAASLAPFLRYLQQHGAGVERHLDAGWIPGDLVERPDAWITKLQAYRVLESATRRDTNESLGLEVGRNIALPDLGAVGEAIACAPTLRDACATFARRLPQFAQGNRVSVRDASRKTWFTFTTLDHEKGARDVADHYGLMILLAIVRGVAGRDWVPHEVHLQTGITSAFAQADGWAGAHVDFDQQGTGFAFPSRWLSRPLDSRRSDVDGLPAVSQLDTLTAALHALLETYLPVGGAPTIDMAADVLGMSPRTLKRRLAAEGVSYSLILERVRFALATSLLQDPAVSVRDVAFELGYSGPNNFVRAFRRLAGCTPGEFRTRLEAQSSTAEASDRLDRA